MDLGVENMRTACSKYPLALRRCTASVTGDHVSAELSRVDMVPVAIEPA